MISHLVLWKCLGPNKNLCISKTVLYNFVYFQSRLLWFLSLIIFKPYIIESKVHTFSVRFFYNRESMWCHQQTVRVKPFSLLVLIPMIFLFDLIILDKNLCTNKEQIRKTRIALSYTSSNMKQLRIVTISRHTRVCFVMKYLHPSSHIKSTKMILIFFKEINMPHCQKPF